MLVQLQGLSFTEGNESILTSNIVGHFVFLWVFERVFGYYAL